MYEAQEKLEYLRKIGLWCQIKKRTANTVYN
jgi:hypothetical protein